MNETDSVACVALAVPLQLADCPYVTQCYDGFRRRQALCIIILAGIVTGSIGCRSLDRPVFSESQIGQIEDIKRHSDSHKHVILVCIYEDYFDKMPGPEYDLHHFRATVVRSYKGTWKVSERIALVRGTDADASEQVSNALAGTLLYVFTNEHSQCEIGLEAGESLIYDPELHRFFRFIFSDEG